MGRARAVLVGLLLVASAAAAGELVPAMVWVGTAPSGSCVGSRVATVAATGATYCCSGGTWSACGGSTGPSGPSGPAGPSGPSGPTGTVLLTNPAPCTGSNWVKDIAADGTLTCTQVALDDLASPAGNKVFTMANKTLVFSYQAPAGGDGAFEIEAIGGFTGDLVHIHQHTGNPGAGTDLIHAEWSDTDVTGLRLTGPSAAATAATITGVVSASGFTGPLTGNASTATALAADPTACGAGAYVSDISAAGVLTCSTPPGTYTLPAASTTLGGVKMASACGAGNHVSSIGAGGELACTADSGGSGAPTTAQYWVGAADAGLSAEKDLSGFTGLVLNTAGTPSSKAANTCTNQFARSDNASGVWTCASIATADLPAIDISKGGTTETASTEDAVLVGAGTTDWAPKVLPSCSNATTSKLLYDTATNSFSCGTDQTSAGGASVAGTLVRTTATWASSATANTIGIVGTGATPLTSPTYSAAAPFSFRCWGPMTRPSTTNQPRYGISTTGSVTTLTTQVRIGLAGTAPAFTEALQSTTAAATAGCAAGCTANVITGGAARAFIDTIEGAGVMNASGTLSLVMAPSAAAAHTAGIGFTCIWY